MGSAGSLSECGVLVVSLGSVLHMASLRSLASHSDRVPQIQALNATPHHQCFHPFLISIVIFSKPWTESDVRDYAMTWMAETHRGVFRGFLMRWRVEYHAGNRDQGTMIAKIDIVVADNISNFTKFVSVIIRVGEVGSVELATRHKASPWDSGMQHN